MGDPPDHPEPPRRPETSLQPLRKQYYALVPPYHLRVPPPEILGTEEAQAFLVDRILCDGAGELPGPEMGYRRGFWRKVVGVVERGVGMLREVDSELELEVDERIYEAVADLMVSASGSSGSLTEPPESHRTFIYDQPDWAASSPDPSDASDASGRAGATTERERERRITLLEEQVVLQAGTTGLRTWTAALHLGHHILSHPHLIFRQSSSRDDGSPSPSPHPLPCEIVELGAGTGFLSILLAQLGSDVISTDLGEPGDSQGDEQTQTPFKRLIFNARLNEVSTGGRLRVEALDWTDASRDEVDRPGIWRTLMAPRTIVAADVIYDPDLVPPLVATIRVLIGAKQRHDRGSHERRQSEAIIAATVRNPATLRLFRDTCEKEDLLVDTLDLSPMDDDDPTFWDSGLDRSASVRIMRITPRAPAA